MRPIAPRNRVTTLPTSMFSNKRPMGQTGEPEQETYKTSSTTLNKDRFGPLPPKKGDTPPVSDVDVPMAEKEEEEETEDLPPAPKKTKKRVDFVEKKEEGHLPPPPEVVEPPPPRPVEVYVPIENPLQMRQETVDGQQQQRTSNFWEALGLSVLAAVFVYLLVSIGTPKLTQEIRAARV